MKDFKHKILDPESRIWISKSADVNTVDIREGWTQ
jgi:hypothetical protein